MKKSIRKIIALSAIVLGAIATVSTALFTKESNENNIEAASAESWANGPVVYFVPHDEWEMKIDGSLPRYNFKSWDGDKGERDGGEMTCIGTSTVPGPYYGRRVFMFDVSDSDWINKIQIQRMDAGYNQKNWSGVIYLPNDNGTQVLMTRNDLDYWNEWTTATPGVWINNSLVQKAVYKTTDQSPSSSTGRVFFYNSGTHWASAAGCAVYAWGGSASPKIWSNRDEVADATIYNLHWFTDDNGTSYGYADIPLDVEHYKFCTITDPDAYVTAIGYYSSNQFDIDSFAYVRKGQTEGNYIDTDGAQGEAGAELMKKVVEARNTCSSSVLNGYGDYNALNASFYSKATAAAKSATVQSLSGNTTTIQAHFEGMQARSSSSSGAKIISIINLKENSGSMLAVIASILVALIAVGGYFLLRKKRI